MMQPLMISANLVTFILSQLHLHKLQGPDGLRPHLLRLLMPVISQPTVRLLELFILTEIIVNN